MCLILVEYSGCIFAVEKALPQVFPSITASEARKLFHESRENGVAVVIVTVKVSINHITDKHFPSL